MGVWKDGGNKKINQNFFHFMISSQECLKIKPFHFKLFLRQLTKVNQIYFRCHKNHLIYFVQICVSDLLFKFVSQLDIMCRSNLFEKLFIFVHCHSTGIYEQF